MWRRNSAKTARYLYSTPSNRHWRYGTSSPHLLSSLQKTLEIPLLQTYSAPYSGHWRYLYSTPTQLPPADIGDISTPHLLSSLQQTLEIPLLHTHSTPSSRHRRLLCSTHTSGNQTIWGSSPKTPVPLPLPSVCGHDVQYILFWYTYNVLLNIHRHPYSTYSRQSYNSLPTSPGLLLIQQICPPPFHLPTHKHDHIRKHANASCPLPPLHPAGLLPAPRFPQHSSCPSTSVYICSLAGEVPARCGSPLLSSTLAIQDSAGKATYGMDLGMGVECVRVQCGATRDRVQSGEKAYRHPR